MSKLTPTDDSDAIAGKIANEIVASTDSPRKRALKKFALAAVGAIPWVGGFIAAAIELRENPDKIDHLQKQWLEHHTEKIQKLEDMLVGIAQRLENFGDSINDRIESPSFLSLVDKGFRQWDESATEEKRDFVRRLLTNAAASSLCNDDLIRLFLDWIRKYDETHFRVIEAIYRKPGISRRGMWQSMGRPIPRDDSAEADLFKLLIHDLSLGHVIRQHRPTNYAGEFLLKSTKGTRNAVGGTMKSPFDSESQYELTELGSQFVHYVMNEVAPQIGRRTNPLNRSDGATRP